MAQRHGGFVCYVECSTQVNSRAESSVCASHGMAGGRSPKAGTGDCGCGTWKRGRCLRTLKGRGNWAGSADLAQDVQRVVSGDFRGTVRVWDLETGKTTM